ncbi:hypothetical protein CVT91_04620 [Candidatus Atribacteria bacterium HGW-Atribacteria-1]|nr:MAG: hypothetical protein CVT91_04620 [Candidatus Atribacteria bacterium HGW-Atribacteria-1]
MVEMFDNRIDITNFGGLAKGLKPEDFGKKSVLRNPNIANLLHRAGYIEKMGTGINKMKNLISKAGLPPIKFEFDSFFTATFQRPKTVEKTREKIIDLIKNNPKITTVELAEILEITVKGVEWNIKKLKEKGIVRRIGPAKGGYWKVVEK